VTTPCCNKVTSSPSSPHLFTALPLCGRWSVTDRFARRFSRPTSSNVPCVAKLVSRQMRSLRPDSLSLSLSHSHCSPLGVPIVETAQRDQIEGGGVPCPRCRWVRRESCLRFSSASCGAHPAFPSHKHSKPSPDPHPHGPAPPDASPHGGDGRGAHDDAPPRDDARGNDA
jgi:hypothetical protein